MTPTIISDNDSGVTVRCWTPADSFEADYLSVAVSTGGDSLGTFTAYDAEYEQFDAALLTHEAQVLTDRPSSFESLDEDVALVDGAGYVSRVSDGRARILVRGPHSTRRLDIAVRQDLETSSGPRFQNFVSGSLAAHCTAAVDSRIAGLSPSLGVAVFSTQNQSDTPPLVVRNVHCWVHDLTNKTAASPWNNRQGGKQAGTLVSPRDFICCGHFTNPLRAGDLVRFVDDDSVIHDLTISGFVDYTSEAVDLRILSLTEDVPESIGWCKVLPQNWRDLLPSLDSAVASDVLNGSGILRVPAMFTDQNEGAFVADLFADSNTGSQRYVPPLDAQRSAYFKAVISGDSGSPVFLLVNGELVLVAIVSGPTRITDQKTRINAAMETLGSPYQLTEIDLSDFTDFS